MEFYRPLEGNDLVVVEKETGKVCVLWFFDTYYPANSFSENLTNIFNSYKQSKFVKVDDINLIPKAAYEVAFKWALKTCLDGV